jgi:hypothetical protein
MRPSYALELVDKSSKAEMQIGQLADEVAAEGAMQSRWATVEDWGWERVRTVEGGILSGSELL